MCQFPTLMIFPNLLNPFTPFDHGNNTKNDHVSNSAFGGEFMQVETDTEDPAAADEVVSPGSTTSRKRAICPGS